MKRSGARFLIASLLMLLLFFDVHSSEATESDPKGSSSSSTSKDGAAADLSSKQLAPPDNEKAGENKKAKEETKEVPEKNEVKETPIKMKDEILKEPEVQDRSEKESSNGDSHVAECDPSNRCVDRKSNFVACLRVPGKDSQDLSLLIQNKGKGSLDVNITAPDFVDLEQNTIQLDAKENKEVKVTVKESGRDTIIVLKAIEGSCSLNFQNTISNPIKKIETSSLSGFFNHLTPSSFILIILAAALLVIASVWSFIRFRRMKSQEGGPKYHLQIDGGLPLSTGGKKEASEVDGWDNNSWGDDWDDEESPMTPSKPVLTPSSRGLASRKFNKDGWKD